jgi:hypothetical protein
MKAKIEQRPDGKWNLLIGDQILGVAATEKRAKTGLYLLESALAEAFDDGYGDGHAEGYDEGYSEGEYSHESEDI